LSAPFVGTLGRVDLGHSSPSEGDYPELDYMVFDNADQLAELPISKTNSNAMAHIVRGRIRTETHHAMNLAGGNAPFAGQHQINDLEPRFETNIRVLKDGPDQQREAIAALFDALGALPVEGAVTDRMNIFIVASRATDAFWPAARDKVLLTGVIGREQLFKLRDRHLRPEFVAHNDHFPYRMDIVSHSQAPDNCPFEGGS
jgi:hypothetical protein